MAQQPTGNVSLATTDNTHNNESNNDGNSVVICTICFDPVIENGPRAVARLGCGHRFHLDCIGSEFNARGIMRCPNCRVIEVGQWRFSNGQCTQSRTNENQAQFLVEAAGVAVCIGGSGSSCRGSCSQQQFFLGVLFLDLSHTDLLDMDLMILLSAINGISFLRPAMPLPKASLPCCTVAIEVPSLSRERILAGPIQLFRP